MLENRRVVVPVVDEEQNKGCHCKKSNCVKNYCECFAAGVCCTELCRCVCCQNPEQNLVEGIGAISEKIGKKKKKSEKSFRDALIEKLASRKNTQELLSENSSEQPNNSQLYLF